jgi:hypothetical protein
MTPTHRLRGCEERLHRRCTEVISLDKQRAFRDVPGIPPEEPAAGLLAIEPKDRPETVDLRIYQSPIKLQWGGTCVQFATTVAIGR